MVRNGFFPPTWFTGIGRRFGKKTKLGMNIVRVISHLVVIASHL